MGRNVTTRPGERGIGGGTVMDGGSGRVRPADGVANRDVDVGRSEIEIPHLNLKGRRAQGNQMACENEGQENNCVSHKFFQGSRQLVDAITAWAV